MLGRHLHPLIPFDYLALLLHDEPRAELRLVVLELDAEDTEREGILRALRESGGVIAGPQGQRASGSEADDAAIEDAEAWDQAAVILRGERKKGRAGRAPRTADLTRPPAAVSGKTGGAILRRQPENLYRYVR